MSRWFRVYDDLVDDPKVQRLPAELFKALINLWCLASRNRGELPSVECISFSLRMRPERAVRVLSDLRDAGLIDCDDTGRRPHNWSGRQFKSDVTDPTNAERQKRFRNAKRNGDRNGDDNTTSNDQRQSTDTESEQIPSLRSGTRARGTRLPADWGLSDEDRTFAEPLLGTRVSDEAAKFRDYWSARAGPGAVKLDWPATWRNWCRKAANDGPPRAGPGRGKPTLVEAADSLLTKMRSFDEPAPGIRDGTGENPVRRLPSQ